MGVRSKRKRSWSVRLVRIAVATLVGLWVAYVVAANVLLSTSLWDRYVNAHPEDALIHFDRGWTLLPPRIHATNLSVRGRDSAIEWRLTIDQVDFDFSFTDVLKQQFSVSNVHGKGLTFRLRQRLAAEPKTPEEVADLPPIAGLPPYSVRPLHPPPEPTDAEYHLWTIHLESTLAEDVREIWIDHARFEGEARVEGRLYFKPLRALEVGPCRVSVTSGDVLRGKQSIARGLDGDTFDVTIERFDPRTTDASTFAKVSFTSDAQVQSIDLGQLGLGEGAGWTVAGEARVTRGAVRVKNGRFEGESHFGLLAPRLVLATKKYHLYGALDLEGDVQSGGVALHARTLATSILREGMPLAWAPEIRVVGDTRALELTEVVDHLHLVADAGSLRIPDARALARFVPPGTPASIDAGRGDAEIHVETWLDEKLARGRGRLRAEGLAFHLAKMSVKGNAALGVTFDGYRFGTKHLGAASLALDVPAGEVSRVSEPASALVRVRQAVLAARSASVDLDDPLRDLSVSISVPSGDVVSRRLLHAYLPRGREMQILTSNSRFTLACDVAVRDHLARGTLDIAVPTLAMEYRDLRLATRLKVRGRVHDWRWETGDLALDEASVDVGRLTLTKAGARHDALSIERIGLSAKSTHFNLTEPLAKVNVSAFFTRAKVHDFSAVNAFLPAEATYRFEGHEATFGATLVAEVQDHVANGGLWARATGAGIELGRLHLLGDVDFFGRFENARRGKLDVPYSRVALSRLSGRFDAGSAPDFSGKSIVLSLRSPQLDLAKPTLRGADVSLTVDQLEIPDARKLDALLPPKSVFGIESGAAHLDADVHIESSQARASGSVDLAIAQARVRLDKTHFFGDFRFVARLAGFDPERDVLDLSGTRLSMQHVAVTGSSANTSNWYGDLMFPRASLALGSHVRFDANAKVEARDIRPVLALVFGDGFPKILVGLFDMPHLTASTHLVAGSQLVALLDLDAHGGNFGLRGSFASREGEHHGALVARKGFFSVGFELDDRGTHVRFFGLDDWLRERTRPAYELVTEP
jgi:hypothetical protein